jgi:uncharacterized protein (DUF1800 family)
MLLRSLAFLLCTTLSLLSVRGLNAQSITTNPGYTSIGVGGTVQYTAAVTGLSNTTVTWSVNGKVGGNSTNGTITSSGLYTAPAAVPSNSVLVGATGSDGKTSSVVYVNVAPVGPSISAIAPNPIQVGTFTVTLTGSGFQNGAVANCNGVSLNTSVVSATTLKATGWQGAVGAATFQVRNPSSLYGPSFTAQFVKGSGAPQTISPTIATVKLGMTQQFTSAGATSWTATAGSVTSSGLYTAPANMPASSTVAVKATGPNGSASATVTLINANPQTISPTAVSLNPGATQQFTATGATSWTATAGTVASSGLYTAPAAMPSSSSVTVTATGPNGSATAMVTLLPPTPVITGVGGNAQLPLGIFTTSIAGTGFLNSSIANLNGTALSTMFLNGLLNITGFYGHSGTASLTVSNGAMTSQPFTVQIGVQNALVSAAAARRFLEQAAFGPTPADATHVQTIGFRAWLTEQFNMTPVSTYNTITSSQGGMPAHFLTMAVSNPDQLRQRVAFALNQIFVTSVQKLIWNDNMVPYQNMLLNDAFTNYRQIMADVTLSPAMGQYLDMANNAKADPSTGSTANENYARELMQLFTIGTNMLNQDGSIQYDAKHLPIPTYSQFTVTEFARVYTGWTYAPAPGQPVEWNVYMTSNGPMASYASEHDMGAKQLLNGYVSPAGISAAQDLNNALDNIFNHPNVGPFVARQLIQHLVKSNPSPTYISRAAAAFNDNGMGVRGDMQATISAILLDAEARANDEGGNDQPTDGHLQEPALFLAAMVRAFGGQMNDQNYYPYELVDLGQDLFDSPSVFNYYAPDYVIPGTALMGGEFQIHTPNTAIIRANEVSSLFSQYSNPIQSYGPGTTIDLTPFLSLAAAPATLVDALDLTLTHGVMPATMKSAVVNAVMADTGSSLHKVQTACYLILGSSYYNVWH